MELEPKAKKLMVRQILTPANQEALELWMRSLNDGNIFIFLRQEGETLGKAYLNLRTDGKLELDRKTMPDWWNAVDNQKSVDQLLNAYTARKKALPAGPPQIMLGVYDNEKRILLRKSEHTRLHAIPRANAKKGVELAEQLEKLANLNIGIPLQAEMWKLVFREFNPFTACCTYFYLLAKPLEKVFQTIGNKAGAIHQNLQPCSVENIQEFFKSGRLHPESIQTFEKYPFLLPT